MVQETAFARANSGQITIPGGQFGDVRLGRDGITGLDFGQGPLGGVSWDQIGRIDVYSDQAVWTSKKGKKVRVFHDHNDKRSVAGYIDVEGVVMFWARQSGHWTRLRDGTPAFKLDVPPVFFHCPSDKDKRADMHVGAEFGGQGPIRTRSFAYHYQVYDEIAKIKKEQKESAGESEVE